MLITLFNLYATLDAGVSHSTVWKLTITDSVQSKQETREYTAMLRHLFNYVAEIKEKSYCLYVKLNI